MKIEAFGILKQFGEADPGDILIGRVNNKPSFIIKCFQEISTENKIDHFVLLNNAFNEQNLFTYTYNFDYSQQIPVVSTNERTIWFGIGVAF